MPPKISTNVYPEADDFHIQSQSFGFRILKSIDTVHDCFCFRTIIVSERFKLEFSYSAVTSLSPNYIFSTSRWFISMHIGTHISVLPICILVCYYILYYILLYDVLQTFGEPYIIITTWKTRRKLLRNLACSDDRVSE